MIHRIENKKVQAVLKNETIELPFELKTKINENFEYMKSQGANIWNGDVLCVSRCDINDNDVKIICKKSDYAHYLYGERIGCPKEYECKNLSAGCLLETIDGYYIVGELDEDTSYPTMLQVTGGEIDKDDISEGIINIENTIIREAREELNIDLDNEKEILYNKLSYIHIPNEDERSGVQLFSKAKMQMTAKEMDNYFNNYYNYLKKNSLEIEFKKLHFLKKENAIEELMRLNNPKRNYLEPLIQMDLKEIKIMEDINLIQILWDYMKMNHELRHSDCIIGLGTKDTNVANVASELYLNGYANKLIFSGGLGKITYKLWNETEAEKFARIAIEKGVPREDIYLEKESTNTGDNFRFSKRLIEKEGLDIKSCIVVCKPYDEKRAYAAFKKIMPQYEVIIYSEDISCEEYYKRNGNDWIDVLVGDIQRMKLFFEKGWQIEMDIPKEVWNAYGILVKRGYDKFILKNQQDEGEKKNIEIKLNKVL